MSHALKFVNAQTGTHLIKECLLSLLGSNIVIYIMHQVELLPAANPILAMYKLRSQKCLHLSRFWIRKNTFVMVGFEATY